ncbi:MAG TPA: hypothetical protein VFC94_05400 [Bacteroidaceae bacterium]|nr:hypothetical protein [Bacteroidaceae bacterium]
MKKLYIFVLSVMFFIGLNLSCTPSEPDAETDVISTGVASDISLFSVTLSGTINGLSSTQISRGKFGFLYIQDEALNGNSAADIFQDCLNNNLTGSCSVQHVTNIQPGGKFSMDLKKLKSGSIYHYCTFLVKSDNSAYIGSISSFSTTSFPPETSTEGAAEINFYSAKLSGCVSISKADLTSVNIGIVYSTSDIPASGSGTLVRFSLDLDENGNFTVPISGLKPETGYYYRTYVYIINDREYYYSDINYFRTKDLSDMAIDLGLSVKWASCNLGAENPMDYGDYYRWGEIVPNTSGLIDGYRHYNPSKGNFSDLGEDISGTEYDAAHVRLGGKWRMPTKEECEELLSRCVWTGIVGDIKSERRVTGPSGKQIIIPPAGHISYSTLSGGYSFWASTIYNPNDSGAYRYWGATQYVPNAKPGEEYKMTNILEAVFRYISMPIRPVCE